MQRSKDQFMELREESGVQFEHLLDAKKVNINTAIAAIKSQIEAGNVDSLKGLILAAKGKMLFTELEKELRPLAEGEYLNKIEKGYAKHDVEVNQGATKTEYDYSVCNDPEWNNLDALNAANGKLQKDRETFLKTLKKPMEIVDTDTGETYTVYPPNKLQKEGLKLTIR